MYGNGYPHADQLTPNLITGVLDEIIQRVEHGGERDVIARIMNMTLHPFKDEWGMNPEEEKKWIGDVPRGNRQMMCSCSS